MQNFEGGVESENQEKNTQTALVACMLEDEETDSGKTTEPISIKLDI